MFIIYPVEGLANRLRAVNSAMLLRSVRHKSVRIRWWKDTGLMCCDWEDLFEKNRFVTKSGGSYDFIQLYFKAKRHSRIVRMISGLFAKARIIQILGPDDWQQLRDAANGKGECLVNIALSFSVFFSDNARFELPDSSRCDKSIFTLNKEMKAKLETLTKAFDDRTIGIHIRRTDNKEAIAKSPLELFTDRMSDELVSDPENKFFVCSDDDVIKKVLVERFGTDKIITSAGPVCRNSTEGIKQAALELFALSRTSRIIGSYFSSFSEMAAWFGNIKLEQVYKND